MREFKSKKIEAGEHILIDSVEFVAIKTEEESCDSCVLRSSEMCNAIPSCIGIYFNKVEKEPTYRPYKDTDEMIADFKKRFKVSMPSFCKPLIWVKYKNGASVYRRLISAFTDACVGFDDIFMSVRELFDGYTYLDGSPCGKVEE